MARREKSAEELAREIRAESRSISFDSILRAFRESYPEAHLHWHERQLPLSQLAPTEVALEKKKMEKVRRLFRRKQAFDGVNRAHFAHHPVSAIHIEGELHGIIDGHHRLRRLAELAGRDAQVHCTVVASRSWELVENFREQIKNVRRNCRSTHVSDLPVE